MTRPSFFTLLMAVAIAQVLVANGPLGANALQGYEPQVARRAVHVDMNQRMVKKRRPQDAGDSTGVDNGIINVVPDPPQGSNSGVSSAPATTSVAPTTTKTTASAAATSSGGNIIASLTNILNNSSNTSSSSSTSGTSTSASSSAAPTSAPPTTSATSRTSDRSTGTVTVIASVSAPATSLPPAQNPDSSFLSHSAVIGLIVTGSCIVAAAAIWTIIRKWKFSPSRHFEDRLEPINWEPTQSSGVAAHDPTIAALSRTGSRTGSNRPHSYASADGEMSTTHHEPISMAPDFPPAHDFTAGAATGGYVDMHRGASPAPGAYGAAYGGQYETPNPYDAYDYNNSGYGQRRY